MTAPKPPPPAKAARARLLYDSGQPLGEIAKTLGMSEARFRAWRMSEGWPSRAANRRKDPAAETPAKAEPRRPLDHGRLIARLEDAIETEFARVEAALEKQTPKTIETSARALATLVKTLAEFRRLRRDAVETQENAAPADDDTADAPPRELAQLRAELARRLERLGGERPSE